MKFYFSFVLVFSALICQATNFYVNASSISNLENGTKVAPWKNLSSVNNSMSLFKAGDSILFKRGELFIGKLLITCSGVTKSPIVFAAYGSGSSLPCLQYDLSKKQNVTECNIIYLYKCANVTLLNLNITDTTIDENDHSFNAHVNAGINIDQSSNISLKQLDISLVGVGIAIAGDNNLVSNCNIHNLRMVINDDIKSDDDYGAVAIVLGGNKNEIKNNLLKNCWATSADYTYDGGGVEVFGNSINENIITSNVVINCDGFMELGSGSNGSCKDNYVANNLLINNGSLIFIHRGRSYTLTVSNFQLVNNIIIETEAQRKNSDFIVGIGPDHPVEQNIITLKNNLFLLNTGINVAKKGSTAFLNGQLIHENNIYFTSTGSINYQLNTSERLLISDKNKNPDFTATIDFLYTFFIGWFNHYWVYIR